MSVSAQRPAITVCFLAQGLDGVDPVPQQGRPLKPQGLRLRFHLGGHLFQELLGPALQHQRGLMNAAPVLLRRHLRAAEAVAPAHMEVQAGPLNPDIPGELSVAGGQAQGREHRVQCLAGLKPAAEGTEVPGSVIAHLWVMVKRG